MKNIVEIQLGSLSVSEIHTEIFAQFNRDRSPLLDEIRTHKFNREQPLTVINAGKKKGEKILCGAGRFQILQQLNTEITYPDTPQKTVPCEIVEVSDERAIQIILYDNLNTALHFTNFSPFQYKLLAKLYDNFSGKTFPKKSIKCEIGIAESGYQNLNTAVNFAIERLKNIYPDEYGEIKKGAQENHIDEKLVELRLINKALKKATWTDFCRFFHGKMVISEFYNRVYKPNKNNLNGPLVPIEPDIKSGPNEKAPELVERIDDFFGRLRDLNVELESDENLKETIFKLPLKAYKEDIEKLLILLKLKPAQKTKTASADKNETQNNVAKENAPTLYLPYQ